MRGTILYGPRDVRFEECDVPRLIKPTDAIIRISATCVCGSVNVLERKRADEALRQTLEEVHRLRDRLQMENVYLREQLRRDGGNASVRTGMADLLKLRENVAIPWGYDGVILAALKFSSVPTEVRFHEVRQTGDEKLQVGPRGRGQMMRMEAKANDFVQRETGN